MRIAVFCPVFPPSQIVNGMGGFADCLSHELVGLGHQVIVVCSDADTTGRLTKENFQKDLPPGLTVSPFRHVLNPWYGLSTELPWIADKAIAEADVVLLNGLFSPASVVAAVGARLRRKPFVFAPHGSLLLGALGRGTFKKQIYLKTFGAQVLNHAAAVVATSEKEEEICRARVTKSQQVQLISLGCTTPPILSAQELSSYQHRWPELNGKQFVLFLGRISPEKGLDTLFEAWREISQSYPDVVLAIAGDGEQALKTSLKNRAASLKITNSVKFLGQVDGTLKWSLLSAATFMVLPSHSEAFGMVVPEALLCGTPVVATEGTPWRELNSSGCGRWVPRSVSAIHDGMAELLALAPEERRAMGAAGRELVKTKYQWSRAARDFESLFKSLN